jgi:hypothetical protein
MRLRMRAQGRSRPCRSPLKPMSRGECPLRLRLNSGTRLEPTKKYFLLCWRNTRHCRNVTGTKSYDGSVALVDEKCKLGFLARPFASTAPTAKFLSTRHRRTLCSRHDWSRDKIATGARHRNSLIRARPRRRGDRVNRREFITLLSARRRGRRCSAARRRCGRSQRARSSRQCR